MTYQQEKLKPYGGEGTKGEQVEQMFDGIAHSYDLLNHTLSFGIDRIWRRAAIRWLAPFKPTNILDVATGTGDFALLTAKRLKPQSVLGVDLSEGMLAVGREKTERAGLSDIVKFKREDCLNLSLPSDTYDAVTVAYGVRNFEDLDKGLSEMCRVLKPNGHLVIIELTAPEHFPMKQLFYLYSHCVMPLLGRLISRDRSAYAYLPASMELFPRENAMRQILQKAGFRNVASRRFTFGISMMYTATK